MNFLRSFMGGLLRTGKEPGDGPAQRRPALPGMKRAPEPGCADASETYSAAVIVPQVAAIFGPRAFRAVIETIESRAASSAYSTRSWPSSRAMKFLRAFICLTP